MTSVAKVFTCLYGRLVEFEQMLSMLFRVFVSLGLFEDRADKTDN